jgi:solute carrier family 25 phosphate transporter 23/24/25/41
VYLHFVIFIEGFEFSFLYEEAYIYILGFSKNFIREEIITIWSLQIPYVGLNFAVYESLKDWLIKTRPYGLVEDSELSVTTRLACGAVAGTIGQTIAYPLDVIRRRMQMVGWKDAASVVTGEGRSKAPLEYTGMIDAFRKTVRHEGFGALYKGLVPNSVKVV